jgi:hypothetical protein
MTRPSSVVKPVTRTPAHIDARRAGRFDQQRIQRHPPNAQRGVWEDRRVQGAFDSNGGVDHHRQAIKLDGPGTHDRVEHAQPVQHLHAAGLDQMSRRGIGWKLCTVNQADAEASPSKHCCQRRPSTSCTNDHDIESFQCRSSSPITK